MSKYVDACSPSTDNAGRLCGGANVICASTVNMSDSSATFAVPQQMLWLP